VGLLMQTIPRTLWYQVEEKITKMKIIETMEMVGCEKLFLVN
jgi:hypothetical protein